jgi:dihydrofolate reductase
MRDVVVTEFISLDGVIEDPGGAEGFEHAGWTVPYWNDEIATFKNDELFASDALLLGRKTYEAFAAAWPERTDEQGFADRMNSLPKYVASTTLDKLEWSSSHVLDGDVAEAVAELKQQPGRDILVYGSGELVRTLMRHDLVDRYQLLVYPIVLGSGRRLFDGAPKKPLRLSETQAFGSGVVLLSLTPET